MNVHETYIKRCLEIAKHGLGYTRPNPMVGCVIVHDDFIIGEGFTSPYGGPHAEVNAIHAVNDKSLLEQSIMYVTLEPCSHFGKTPPCSDLIIKHKIKQLYIGCQDANPKVAGEGIKKLKASGCHIEVGVLEKECREHHIRFFTFYEKKRPFIILKWAESADRFIAPYLKTDTKPVWISNIHSRQLVHKWRAEEQAILVGAKTVRTDNPSLTVRHWTGQHPIRVVINKNKSLKKQLNIFNQEAETLIISADNCDFTRPLADQIAAFLYSKKINSLIVEGGAQTLQTFIDSGLWDEARVFIGPNKIEEGVKAPKLKGSVVSKQMIGGDILKFYRND